MSATANAWRSASAEAHEAMAEALESATIAMREVLELVQPLMRPRIQQTIDELMTEFHTHERAARELRAGREPS